MDAEENGQEGGEQGFGGHGADTGQGPELGHL
jgi:hypothetical protein